MITTTCMVARLPCSVTFDKLPDSYVQPPVTDSSKPYTTSKFNPCGGSYTKFSQVCASRNGTACSTAPRCMALLPVCAANGATLACSQLVCLLTTQY